MDDWSYGKPTVHTTDSDSDVDDDAGFAMAASRRPTQGDSSSDSPAVASRQIQTALDMALVEGAIFTGAQPQYQVADRASRPHGASAATTIIQGIESGLAGDLLQHVRRLGSDRALPNEQGERGSSAESEISAARGIGSGVIGGPSSTAAADGAFGSSPTAAARTGESGIGMGDDGLYLQAVLASSGYHPDRAAALAVLKLQATAAKSALLPSLSRAASSNSSSSGPTLSPFANLAGPASDSARLLLGIISGAAPFSPSIAAPPTAPKRTLVSFSKAAKSPSVGSSSTTTRSSDAISRQSGDLLDGDNSTDQEGGRGTLAHTVGEVRDLLAETFSGEEDYEGADDDTSDAAPFLSSPAQFRLFFQSPKVTVSVGDELPIAPVSTKRRARALLPTVTTAISQSTTTLRPAATQPEQLLPNPLDIMSSFYRTKDLALASRRYFEGMGSSHSLSAPRFCILGADKVGTTGGQKVFNVLELAGREHSASFPVAKPLLDFVTLVPRATDRNLYVLVDPSLPVRPFFDLDMSGWTTPSPNNSAEGAPVYHSPVSGPDWLQGGPQQILNQLLVSPLSQQHYGRQQGSSPSHLTAEVLAWLAHTVLANALRKYFGGVGSEEKGKVQVIPTILTSSVILPPQEGEGKIKLSLHVHYSISNDSSRQEQVFFQNVDEHRLFVLEYLPKILRNEGPEADQMVVQVLDALKAGLHRSSDQADMDQQPPLGEWQQNLLAWHAASSPSVAKATSASDRTNAALKSLLKLLLDTILDRGIYTKWRPFRLPYQTKRGVVDEEVADGKNTNSLQSFVARERFDAAAKEYISGIQVRHNSSEEIKPMVHPALDILSSTVLSATNSADQRTADSHRFLLPLAPTITTFYFPLLESVLTEVSNTVGYYSPATVMLAGLIHPFDCMHGEQEVAIAKTVRSQLLPIARGLYFSLCQSTVESYEAAHGVLQVPSHLDSDTNTSSHVVSLKFQMVMEALRKNSSTGIGDLLITNRGVTEPLTTAFGRASKLAMAVESLRQREEELGSSSQRSTALVGAKRVRDGDDDVENDERQWGATEVARRSSRYGTAIVDYSHASVDVDALSIDELILDKTLFSFKPIVTRDTLDIRASYNPFGFPESMLMDPSSITAPHDGTPQAPLSVATSLLPVSLRPKPPIPSGQRIPIGDFNVRSLLAEVFRCLHPHYDTASVGGYSQEGPLTPMSLPHPPTHNPHAVSGPASLSTCQYEDNGCFRSYYVFQKQNKFCLKLHRHHKATYGQLFITYESIKYRCYSNDCFDRCLHVKWGDESDDGQVALTRDRDLSLPAPSVGAHPRYRRLKQLRDLLFPQFTKDEIAVRYPWLLAE